MSIGYCAEVCMKWFGRETAGAPLKHDVVYAGAQFGVQCFCMPALFPATGVEVATSTNAQGNCDVPCKADPSQICGGGWHNTVIKIDCSTAWGWPFVLSFALCAGLYVGGGVAMNRGRSGGADHWTQLVPNHPFWVTLHSLVRDGVSFSHQRVQGRRGSSARTVRLIEPSAEGGGSGRGSSSKSKSGSKKSSKKGKSSDPAGASRSSIGGGNDDSVAEAAPASPDSPREWTPTRTGHLAVGAREVRRTPVRYAVYPWIATAIQG
jgi:hypothetical protein